MSCRTLHSRHNDCNNVEKNYTRNYISFIIRLFYKLLQILFSIIKEFDMLLTDVIYISTIWKKIFVYLKKNSQN